MTIFNLLLALLWSLLPFVPDGGDAGGAASGEPPAPDPKAPPADPKEPAGGGDSGDPAPAGDGGEGGGPPSEAKQKADREAMYRTRAKEAETKTQNVVKALTPLFIALGIKVEGAEPDPNELAKQVETWQNKYKQERVSNAVHRIATELGAKTGSLMRYLRGGDELSELDPEADNFEQELKSVVQRALTDEPGLKAAAAPPPRSGAEFNGGGGKTLDEQIAEAEKAGDYRTSIRLKEARDNQRHAGAATN